MESIILLANLSILVMIILFAVRMRLDFENLKKRVVEQSDIYKEMKIKIISDEERISTLESDIKSLEGEISAIRKEVERMKYYYVHQQGVKHSNLQAVPQNMLKAGPETSDDVKSKIRKLLEEGKTPDEVQKILGVSYEEVKLILTLMGKVKH